MSLSRCLCVCAVVLLKGGVWCVVREIRAWMEESEMAAAAAAGVTGLAEMQHSVITPLCFCRTTLGTGFSMVPINAPMCRVARSAAKSASVGIRMITRDDH